MGCRIGGRAARRYQVMGPHRTVVASRQETELRALGSPLPPIRPGCDRGSREARQPSDLRVGASA